MALIPADEEQTYTYTNRLYSKLIQFFFVVGIPLHSKQDKLINRLSI